MSRKFRFNPYTLSLGASGAAFALALGWGGTSGAATPGHTRPELEQRFTSTVKPFMQAYCVSCHGKNSPQAQLDLSAYGNMAAVTRDSAHWAIVLDRMNAKQMPPASMPQPSDKQRGHGHRLDQRCAAVRGAAQRGRSRPRECPPPEQLGIRLHHPRPDRRRPAPHPRVSRRPRQSRRLRQQRRVAHARPRPDEKICAGGQRHRRSHGADFAEAWSSPPIPFWPKPTATNTASCASWIFTSASPPISPITFRPRGATAIAPPWAQPNATLPTVAARCKVSPRYLETWCGKR